MKRTQVTELLSNIKATMVSFFSIAMFVALGVGVFAGISWSAPALQTAADKTFDKGSLYDICVQYPYGLTDSDLATLSEVEGVDALEAARSSFAVVLGDTGKLTAKVKSLTSDINDVFDVEGELPDAAGEVALDSAWAKGHGYAIGDVITLQHDVDETKETDDIEQQDGMQYLTCDTYTVTALVTSPEYTSNSTSALGLSTIGSGFVDLIMFVDLTSFDASAYEQGYTDVYIRSDSLRGLSSFEAEYKQRAAQVTDRISQVGDILANERYNSLYSAAKNAVDQGEEQLASLSAQIAEGETLIEQGGQELASGREQLVSGEAQLAAALVQLQEGQAAYDSLSAQLEQARSQVAAYQEQLNYFDSSVAEARTTVADARAFEAALAAQRDAGSITQEEYDAQLDSYCLTLEQRLRDLAASMGASLSLPPGSLSHTNFTSALDGVAGVLDTVESQVVTVNGQSMTVAEARVKLAEAQASLAEGESQLQAADAKLASGWSTYWQSSSQLESARQQLAAGEEELVARQQQLEEGRQAYDTGQAQLAAGKERLAALTEYHWTVLGRDYNGGVRTAKAFSNVTDNLRFSMAALFVIVGLLVCYSAVSRIVHEQVTQIGTKKALGLRNREVTLSFLAYSTLAVVAGALIGALVGTFVVEGIISGVVSGHFVFGRYPPYFSLPQFLLVSGVELMLILLATWVACRSVLKKNAVELLAGGDPPTAKPRFFERWKAWERLPLLTQTIVNNCLNDGRRVLGTVIGVAGCTALIVTAVTLNNNVLASFERQYQDVYGFNAVAYLDTNVETAQANAEDALAQHGLNTAPVCKETYSVKLANGELSTLAVTVPTNEEAFSNLFHLNAVDDKIVDLSVQGVWVCAAYAEHQGAQVGDEIVIMEADGREHNLPIAGFYHNYLIGYQAVMGATTYLSTFGTEPAVNALLVDAQSSDVSALADDVAGVEGLSALTDDRAVSHELFGEFSSVSRAVVGIYLALSVLMAVVVLLNLNVMCIDEKKREVIVLMINGFSVRDAKRYIYRDTIVLTVLGIVAGVVLGAVMGYFTVLSIESVDSSFVKDVDLLACAYGIIGSAVLSFIMSAIALRRIPRFDLTDINRF